MSEYGSGLTFAQCCAYDKERIKMAMQGKLVVGENEDGFIYAPASRQECEHYILSAYDNAVYHARQSMASGRAVEKVMKKKKWKLPFEMYAKQMDKEMEKDYKDTAYRYEEIASEETQKNELEEVIASGDVAKMKTYIWEQAFSMVGVLDTVNEIAGICDYLRNQLEKQRYEIAEIIAGGLQEDEEN